MPKKPVVGKKNILVAGGAGFIGSHLCDELVKGSNVICLDNFISGSEFNIDHLLRHPNFIFVKHDINEPTFLEEMPELKNWQIKIQGIQEIYNLAVPTTPLGFENDKMDTLYTNSRGVLNLLDLAKKYEAKFLQFSSSVVYGPRRDNDRYYPENYVGHVDCLSERACYDEGKRFAETCAATYRQVFGLDAKVLRIFRTHGPRMMLGKGHMIPDFVLNALDNKDLVIHGDKNFTTSLCYISDIIDGILKMMQSEEAGPINLGNPEEVKIIEVAQKIIKMTGSKSKIVFADPLLFMTPLGLPDITRAKELLDWLPITRLEDGLQKTIDYTKGNKDVLRLQAEKV